MSAHIKNNKSASTDATINNYLLEIILYFSTANIYIILQRERGIDRKGWLSASW